MPAGGAAPHIRALRRELKASSLSDPVPLPAALATEGPPIRLIGGPTASGKSALALDLALRTGGAIVNADALQLYQDLRVLSARPTAAEEALAPHRLYGVADAAEGWSVGRWQRAALAELEALAREGRTAVVVGGAGLYFRSLTHGLAEIPSVAAGVRARAAARWDELGEAAFRAELAGRDPAAAERIFPGDRQRLLRAWEVAEATGRSLSDWQAATEAPLAAGDYAAVVVEPPRAILYARCDARFDAMLAGGAVEEVRALVARRLDPDLPAMKAVGVRELGRFVAGELDLEAATALARQETRRYAKRQLTWFRRQTPDWPHFDPTYS